MTTWETSDAQDVDPGWEAGVAILKNGGLATVDMPYGRPGANELQDTMQEYVVDYLNEHGLM